MKDKKGEKQIEKQIGKRRKEKTTRFRFKKAAEFCFEEETFCAGSFALFLKTIETIETILNLICRCNDNLDQGC